MVKSLVLALGVLAFGCTLSGNKNRCETQADCLDGFTCTTAGTCERGTVTCTPITCDGHCGELDDHCGGTLECGACPDHCTNHAIDPTETDVDCGGDCAPCGQGLHCAQTSDCQTGTCDAGTCRAGTWSTVAAMPTPRDRLAAVAAGGLIYAIGGMSSAGPSSAVEVYDPSMNSWSTLAPMPTPRYEFAAVLGTDGRIYVIGGDYADITDPGNSITAAAYNPATNSWQALPAMPVGRTDLAAAVDSNGVIYAIGGYDGSTIHTLGSVATWQLGAASWTTLPDAMTTARDMHGAVTLADGNIYAVGGEHGIAAGEIAAFEYFQPGASGWHTLAPMPTARKALGVAALGSTLYAIAGSRYNSTGMRYTSVVEVYDAAAHAWSQVTSLPSGRFDHAAIALGGNIYVLGGELEQTDARTSIVEVFTPDP
ncbi:MAG TPA: kelch repeat-containing protein [Kofleriaceae bacterium]|nr:kelch repeat-containing protein [Kofleriaceae bacterium]